jgi:protein-tyrosine phosphatase
MERPIPNCYWVEPGRLLAGEYPRDRADDTSQAKIDALVAAGVRVFIDLTTDADRLAPYTPLLARHPGVVHERHPIPDVSVPHSPEQTRTILDAIDARLDAGQTVYVHCWGGVGRTGTIVGCWLARHGYPGDAALARLQELWRACPKSAWRESPETPEQVHYVVTWQKE